MIQLQKGGIKFNVKKVNFKTWQSVGCAAISLSTSDLCRKLIRFCFDCQACAVYGHMTTLCAEWEDPQNCNMMLKIIIMQP